MLIPSRSEDSLSLNPELFSTKTETHTSTISTLENTKSRFVPTSQSTVLGETNDGVNNSPFHLIAEYSKLLGELWRVVAIIDNFDIRNKTCELLNGFQQIVYITKKLDVDISFLPGIKVLPENEDGSLLIEWIFSDFRIGFTLESKIEDSGWYLVSNSNLGSISASGDINKIEINKLVLFLFIFALNHG